MATCRLPCSGWNISAMPPIFACWPKGAPQLCQKNRRREPSHPNYLDRRKPMKAGILCGIALLALFAALPVATHLRAGRAAQSPAEADDAALFTKSDVMIPMRDGAKLHTEIYTPKDSKI